jgi:hypothetical protein
MLYATFDTAVLRDERRVGSGDRVGPCVRFLLLPADLGFFSVSTPSTCSLLSASISESACTVNESDLFSSEKDSISP